MKLSYACLLITILLLPWYIVRWQVAGVPTTLLEASILVTLFVWMIERRPWRLIGKLTSLANNDRGWVIWSGLFLLAALVSVAVSPNHRQALGLLKAYIIEPMAMGLVTVDIVSHNRWRWWGVVIALLTCGIEVALVSFSQLLFGWPNLAPAELVQGRMSSFYASANWVPLMLGPVVAIGAAMLPSIKDRRKMVGLAIVVLAMVLAIALSRSRGGVMGLGAVAIGLGLFYILIHYYQSVLQSKKWWRAGLGAFLAVYLVGCLGFVWFFNHPPVVTNPYSRPGFTTFTIRQCLWQGTKNMLDQRPLFGAGLAGFTDEYLPHSTCDAEPLEDPHMLVLNFWSETGLLGLLVIFGLMSSWLWESYALIADNQRPWVGVGLLLALVYWLIHGLVDVPYFKNDLSMEWWLLVGLVVASRRLWPTAN